MNSGPGIKTLLTIGDNIVIEFRRAGNGLEHDTCKSICAFLDRQGGDVLLGVTDDGKAPCPYSKNPIIANFFHQIGRTDELGNGVRNLYHYVKLYSGANPIFDEKDIFRLTAFLTRPTGNLDSPRRFVVLSETARTSILGHFIATTTREASKSYSSIREDHQEGLWIRGR